MNLVAVYNRQPAIRSSGLLRSAKSDRFLTSDSPRLEVAVHVTSDECDVNAPN